MFLSSDLKNFFDRNISESPFAVLQTGSGIETNDLFDSEVRDIPYSDIPGFPECRVEGHRGRMLILKKKEMSVVVFQGRFHLYEGYDPAEVVLPVSAANYMDSGYLFLLNAAGGIDEKLDPGDTMFINDHINLTGCDPVRAVSIGDRDPAFPDLTGLYSEDIYETALRCSEKELVEGVLVCLKGPCYETPAEVSFLKTAGADAVSMSVVMEAIAAGYFDMEVGAFSIITNRAAGETKHGNVIEISRAKSPVVLKLIFEILSELK